MRARRFPRAILVLAGLVALLAAAGGGLYRRLAVDLPTPDRLYERAAAPSTRIYDRDGRLLYEILDPHGGAHNPVPLDRIPPPCVQATIATEDASFYTNPGVDLRAIVRALWINVRGGEVLAGGSTITQQLARNLLLSPEERTQVTLERKLREAILAWRLARRYSKDEILQLYLNETYYGNLAYGIQAAARTYFAKDAAALDLAECALLAGLPQAPAHYNPLEDPERARERQRVVLGLMVKQGAISAQEAELAAGERLRFASVPFPIRAPHFVMQVRGLLEQHLGREALHTQGLRVHTTLDLDAQRAAEAVVDHRLAQLGDTRAGRPARNIHNAAVVVLDPHSGAVLALVGSPDYFDPRINGAVNGAVTPRQPGSSIKPIVYAAAFDPRRDAPLTAATMMVDVRTAFVTQEGEPYVPRNYDRRWHGPVLLREALGSSYNLIATKVLDDVGLEPTLDLARAMGITTFDDPDRFGLALALGGGEVRLVELTAAYAAFANGGRRVEPVLVTRVEDAGGHVLKAWEAAPGARVLDERVAYLITDVLSDNFARAPAFGEGSALRLSRPAAAKTGTTTDWRDNWTVGYTPELVTGVWVGNADNAPMVDVSGVEGAGPIWHDVMEALLRDHPARAFAEPPGLVRVEVCADSGLPPQAAPASPEGERRPVPCPHTVEEIFIAGTEPARVDDWHWRVALDARNGLLAGPGCPAEHVAYRTYTRYPAEAEPWVRWQNVPQPPAAYSPLCPGAADAEAAPPAAADEASTPLVMVSPDPGGRYRLSPEIPAAAQRVWVAARAAEGVAAAEVTLLVDGDVLTTLRAPPYRALWPMVEGRHVFSVRGVDAQGRALEGDRVTIEVVR
jgi:1A family penicillin-binding protein